LSESENRGSAVSPEKKPRGYEIISDAELWTALRDRPVLILPQAEASPRIVLLDR